MKSINTHNEMGKCTLFEKPEHPEDIRQKEREYIKYLVSGIKSNRPETPKEYFYCETARDSDRMCGIEGHKFEGKPKPEDSKNS